MARKLHTGYEWLDRLMPEGIPIPASILISGPGGSGKPLVGLAMVAAWLRQGGKVVLVPLQYPDRAFAEGDLAKLYGLRLRDYAGSFFFVKLSLDLEPKAQAVERVAPDEVRANLVNPTVFAHALALATETLGESTLGTLVFGTALNLLLFSPTYGEKTLAWLQDMLRNDKSCTYLFTVSSSALREKIEALEQVADHLLYAEIVRPERRLRFWVARLRGASHVEEPGWAPFDQKTLAEMKETADESRVANIPAIRKI